MAIWTTMCAIVVSCAVLLAASPTSVAADRNAGVDIFGKVWKSVVTVITERGQGSGVVLQDDLVVTACHVVGFRSSFETDDKTVSSKISVKVVEDITRPQMPITMKASFEGHVGNEDLCFLRVDGLSELPTPAPAILGTVLRLEVGEDVCAVGTPSGLPMSITCGVVSQKLNCQIDGFGTPCELLPPKIILTDTKISGGSSGGGLFNGNGELIGITTGTRIRLQFTDAGHGNAPAFVEEVLSVALPVDWITGNIRYSRALAEASRRSLEVEDFGRAGKLAKQIRHSEFRREALNRYSRALSQASKRSLEAGDAAEARELAELIYDGELRAATLKYIIRAQIKSSDLSGVTETTKLARRIERRRYLYSDHVQDLVAVSAHMHRSGDIQGAKEALARALEVSDAYHQQIRGSYNMAMGRVGPGPGLMRALDYAGKFVEPMRRRYRLSLLQISHVQLEILDVEGARLS